MNPGRFLRTVRHLSAEQWLLRAKCRGRRAVMSITPTPFHVATRRAAARLPLPDVGVPALVAAAAPVAALQRAVHGSNYGDARRGRFALLNEVFDFGACDAIAWRGEFRDADGPLRRMTLACMGYVVPLLARGDASDLRSVRAILQTLEDQNHWSVRGVFGDVWHPYAVSHRLINLLAGLALYRDRGGSADPDAESAILAHVRFCAAFIAANLERDVQYNHLLKNYVALAVYCAGLDRLPPQMEVLRLAVPNSVRQCVLRDGGHVERSPMYHVLALIDLKVLRGTGLFADQWRRLLDTTIARMEEALSVITHPDGDIALFNDAWLGEAPRSAEFVGTGDTAETARLPDTGYVRIGRGGDAIVFDCGPVGPDDNPTHAHGDFLSLELSVGGARLIVDPGVPTYTAGARRQQTRSAITHNGPRVAGFEPVEPWRSFRVGRRGVAGEIADDRLAGIAPLWCAGWQLGYAFCGVEVRRFAGLWPREGALVCDLWRGRERGAELAGFLIPAHWRVVSTSPLTLVHGARRIVVQTLAGEMGEVTTASHWQRFGLAEGAIRIEARANGANGVRRLATWFSWSEKAPPRAQEVDAVFQRLAAA